jgi:hypothetical protein
MIEAHPDLKPMRRALAKEEKNKKPVGRSERRSSEGDGKRKSKG